MTANQISYWNLQETGRHNQTTERETERHNRASETIDLGKLNESIRHNLASEGIELGKLNETIRSNKANQQETQRHNLATENISQSQISETGRHNLATEGQNQFDLNIKADQLGEQYRHNLATEATNKLTATAQAAKDNAQAKYQDIVNTWEQIRQSQNIELTQSNINAVNKQIQKMEADIERARRLNTTDAWNAANNSINSVARIVDAFIPG